MTTDLKILPSYDNASLYCGDVALDRGYEVLTTHAVNAPGKVSM